MNKLKSNPEKMRKEKRGLQAVSLLQIFILLVGIVAIGWAVGSEVGVVRGDEVRYIINKDTEEMDTISPDSKIPSGFREPTKNEINDLNKIMANNDNLNTKKQKLLYNEKHSSQTNIPTEYGGKRGKPAKMMGVGEKAAASKSGSWLTGAGGVWHGVVSGASWAITAYGISKMALGLFGVEGKQKQAISKALTAGVFAGRSVTTMTKQGGILGGSNGKFMGMKSGTAGVATGILVAAAVYYFTAEETEKFVVNYKCRPWSAPTGGEHCEKCNKMNNGLPCSKYQCKSLGQSCELLNEGSPQAKCEWVDEDDTKPPVLKPYKEALKDNYKYTAPGSMSPPDRGTGIAYTKSQHGCVPAFTRLTFGVKTDEPSRCKVDFKRKEYKKNSKKTFKSMSNFFGGSGMYRYNHTQMMNLPGPNSGGENITIKNDGKYNLYVRCMDANGNINTANYVFKYCVKEGPDRTPPNMVTTDVLNGKPVAYNKSSMNISLYTNEPADCRWSKEDTTYKNMDNEMSCTSSIREINAQALYPCTGKLTGIKDRKTNKFYFKCKDQPQAEEKDRNVNREPLEFTLEGTEPLVLDSASPNGTTIKDSTDSVKVTLEAETSAGHKDGLSTCFYKPAGADSEPVKFKNTNTNTHSQDLHLTEGLYSYNIRCVDPGGNSDSEKISFAVDSDSTAPEVTRAYKEQKYLKVVTNEPGECAYSTDSEQKCNYQYKDASTMTVEGNGTSHYTEWNTDNQYYIKCKDKYGNRPMPSECSMIVKPYKKEE